MSRKNSRCLILLGTTGGAIALILWWLTRGTTFFFDDWDFVLHPANSIKSLIAPHNEHLIAIPRLIYSLLERTVGLENYDVWRAMIVAFNAGLALLVGVIVWMRRGVAIAVGAMLVVGLAGSSWQNLLWAFQITLVGSLLCGFAALALLEFRPRALTISISACILAIGAVAFSGIGVATAVMLAAWVIWSRRWRDLWIPILPLGIYAGWRIIEVTSAQHPSSLSTVIHFMWDMAVAVPQGLVGGNRALGIFALLVLVVGVVHRFFRTPQSRAWLFAISAGIMSEWFLTAVSRSEFGEPDASRYVHIGTVFLVLLAAEAVSPLATLMSRASSVVLAMSIVAVTWPLLGARAAEFRSRSELVRSELAAIELLVEVPPDYVPDRLNAPQVNAADYLSIKDRFGSPAYSVAALETTSDAAREGADRVLVELLRAKTATNQGRADCSRVQGEQLKVVGNGRWGTIAEGAPVAVYANYFGPYTSMNLVESVPAGGSFGVEYPEFVPGRTWHVSFESAAPFEVCRAGE